MFFNVEVFILFRLSSGPSMIVCNCSGLINSVNLNTNGRVCLLRSILLHSPASQIPFLHNLEKVFSMPSDATSCSPILFHSPSVKKNRKKIPFSLKNGPTLGVKLGMIFFRCNIYIYREREMCLCCALVGKLIFVLWKRGTHTSERNPCAQAKWKSIRKNRLQNNFLQMHCRVVSSISYFRFFFV